MKNLFSRPLFGFILFILMVFSISNSVVAAAFIPFNSLQNSLFKMVY